MTPATSGPTSLQPSAFYDPDSQCWKTSPATSLWALPMSSVTLPRWGMTRGGELYELPTPEPPTAANGSSSLLPTPVADHSRGLPQPTTDFQSLPNAVMALMPTPTVMDMGRGRTPEEWDRWTAKMRAAHGNGERARQVARDRGAAPVEWGAYDAAIARWAAVLGRPAPGPVDDGRLNPRFAEWLMGLPEGHVTDVPGLSAPAQLKAIGNGVVPQQAALALRLLLADMAAAA